MSEEEDIPEVPDRVRRFLAEYIDTYEQLEVLLHLCRERQPFDAATLARRLRVRSTELEEALATLCKAGLLVSIEIEGQDHFQFQPSVGELEAIVAQLARAYDEQRLEIVTLMNANAMDRIRNAAARTFADSFLVRKKDNDG